MEGLRARAFHLTVKKERAVTHDTDGNPWINEVIGLEPCDEVGLQLADRLTGNREFTEERIGNMSIFADKKAVKREVGLPIHIDAYGIA